MPDISGLGSFGNVSYSFGSSDLKLPTTGTNFTAMPDFYASGSGSLANSGQSNFSFSNSALGQSIGAGGGSGPFGSGSGMFEQPAILAALRDRFSPGTISAPVIAGVTSTKPNTPPSPAMSPQPTQKTQAFDPSIFKGTQFTPLTSLYDPNGAPIKFSILRDPSLTNVLSSNTTAQTNMFSRDPQLLSSGAQVTFKFANGGNAVAGKLQAGAIPSATPDGKSYEVKIPSGQFEFWRGTLSKERIGEILPPLGVSVLRDGTEVSNVSKADQDTLLKLEYLSNPPGNASNTPNDIREIAKELSLKFGAQLQIDWENGSPISNAAVSKTRGEIAPLLQSIFETSSPSNATPTVLFNGPLFNGPNPMYYGGGTTANTKFTFTTINALPQLNVSSPVANPNANFSRVFDVSQGNVNYVTAQGSQMNLFGAMPSLEPTYQNKMFSMATGLPGTTADRTAMFQDAAKKVLDKYGAYMQPAAKNYLNNSVANSTYILSEQDFGRATGNTFDNVKSMAGQFIPLSKGGPATYINGYGMGKQELASTIGHEGTHGATAPEFRAALLNSSALSPFAMTLREGLTEKFTQDAGFASATYSKEVGFIENQLKPIVGEEVLRRAYFGGDEASIKAIEQAVAGLRPPI